MLISAKQGLGLPSKSGRLVALGGSLPFVYSKEGHLSVFIIYTLNQSKFSILEVYEAKIQLSS